MNTTAQDQLLQASMVWTSIGFGALRFCLLALLMRLPSGLFARQWPYEMRYGLWVAVSVLGCFLVYCLATHTSVNPWYIAPPAGLACLGLEVLYYHSGILALSGGGQKGPIPGLRLGPAVSVLVLLLGLPSAWFHRDVRQTNVDLIAKMLQEAATERDYIVVLPWWYGVSFQYYYQGKTPWETLAPLPDHVMHRFDLVQKGLDEGGGSTLAEPVLLRMRETLRRGGIVWVVGKPYQFKTIREPEKVRLRPGLTSKERFLEASGLWSSLLVAVAQEERAQVQMVELADLDKVNANENPDLFRLAPPPQTESE